MYSPATEGYLPDLVTTARAYCALIDRIDHLASDELLNAAAHLLPRLHAAVRSLPKSPAEGPLHPLVDLETRFALYRRIRDRLGERDAYRMDHDYAISGSLQSGSLADDLTDIYFDLRRGLQRLDEGTPGACYLALCDWSLSYDVHWGEHLVDAERHLSHLMQQRPH